MLRPNKFRPFETRILSGISLSLLSAGTAGVLLGIYRADWRILVASVGIGVLAAVYLCAARRGKPL